MSNIKFQIVENSDEGIDLAENIIYQNCDKNTVLFLSGGNTPKPLYQKLALEQKLKAGAVGMVDDRYTFHQQYSNEIMIKDSGLTKFLDQKNIAFYPILKFGLSRQKTAQEYDETVRFLLTHFPKSVAILGIGADGHTAGIPIDADLKSMENKLVMDYDTFPTEPKDRVTLTFTALSMIDCLIVLVFGEDKKEVVKNLPDFYKREDIIKKTILITDQKLT